MSKVDQQWQSGHRRARLFIEPKAARAGAARIALEVGGLDALLERLAAERIDHEPLELHSNLPESAGLVVDGRELPSVEWRLIGVQNASMDSKASPVSSRRVDQERRWTSSFLRVAKKRSATA